MWVVSIFLLEMMGLATAARADAVPECVRFIYLDMASKKDSEIPLKACSKIENEVARECAHIGTLNSERLEKAIGEAAEEMKAYYLGIQEAQKCWLTTQLSSSLPFYVGWVARFGLMGDQEMANRKARDAAYDNVMKGIKTPGDMPTRSRGEIVDSQATKICKEIRMQQQAGRPPLRPEAKAAFELAVDVAAHYYLSHHMSEAAQRGDAKAIRELYGNQPERRAAEMAKMRARVAEIEREQEKVFKSLEGAGASVIKFMTDASASNLPFGISPRGVKNDLPCMAKEQIAKARGLLCSVARATAAFDNYKPGELFERRAPSSQLVANGTAEKIAEVIHENCENGPVKRGNGEVEAKQMPPSYPLP